ncbi:hypothetical protein ACJIZ3_014950 [Penstemon smallii]|uniref:Uncharacterized protein n=1 Tax=Penstemon smallii TaxID=265156 RepID=A0ABD3RNE3_9LAMI
MCQEYGDALMCHLCIHQNYMLSSSELLSFLILYLLSTGNDAVGGSLNDLPAPTVVISCILPTSLHTLSSICIQFERSSITTISAVIHTDFLKYFTSVSKFALYNIASTLLKANGISRIVLRNLSAVPNLVSPRGLDPILLHFLQTSIMNEKKNHIPSTSASETSSLVTFNAPWPEVALTLSQCKGFNLSFDPSFSSESPFIDELAPLFTSPVGLFFSVLGLLFGLGLFGSGLITGLETNKAMELVAEAAAAVVVELGFSIRSISGGGGGAANLALTGVYDSVLLGCNCPEEEASVGGSAGGGGGGEGGRECLIDGIITSFNPNYDYLPCDSYDSAVNLKTRCSLTTLVEYKNWYHDSRHLMTTLVVANLCSEVAVALSMAAVAEVPDLNPIADSIPSVRTPDDIAITGFAAAAPLAGGSNSGGGGVEVTGNKGWCRILLLFTSTFVVWTLKDARNDRIKKMVMGGGAVSVAMGVQYTIYRFVLGAVTTNTIFLVILKQHKTFDNDCDVRVDL